jgi:hypothetical protein
MRGLVKKFVAHAGEGQMITDQNHDPITYKSVRNRLSTRIEVIGMGSKNLSAETLKNIHDDLREIRAALDCLHDDGVSKGEPPCWPSQAVNAVPWA